MLIILQVLHDTGIHHLRLLLLLGKLALFMFLPVWLLHDLRPLISELENSKTGESSVNLRVLTLLAIDGVLNWLQNIVAFSVLSIVTPLTYAVASASKRIFVIAVTLFILGNPVTGLNVFGMFMAIAGVLCYNKAKHDQREDKRKAALLPRYNTTTTNLLVNGTKDFAHTNGWSNETHKLFAA